MTPQLPFTRNESILLFEILAKIIGHIPRNADRSNATPNMSFKFSPAEEIDLENIQKKLRGSL